MKSQHRAASKWGLKVIGRGFTIIPSDLLRINSYLKQKDEQISPTEMLVLLNLISYWWEDDKMPWPSKATIARNVGLSTRQVQRALNGLESKELIERVARYQRGKGRMSNKYDLTKLVQLLHYV